MKKNKKGFTLVELLAVIVILGVLLMIAVPAIQNVINKSKKNSFESQAKLIIENVETMLSATEIEKKPTSTCYIKAGDIKLERGTLGDKAKEGYITVTPDQTKDTGYSVSITIGDGTYLISNGTWDALGTTNSTTAPKFDSAAQTPVCDFYD